jgi:hypothetical protein
MDTAAFKALKAHILPLSRAATFEQARHEWDLVSIEISDDVDYCPCGQEIREHCYIRNRETLNETYVGNVCINRFLGIDTSTLFAGLKRVRTDQHARPNDALIQYAWKSGFLYGDREYEFLVSIKRKRILSVSQRAWLEKINRRILGQIVVKRRGDGRI